MAGECNASRMRSRAICSGDQAHQQVRQVSAQALSSLVSPESAVNELVQFDLAAAASARGGNAQHGCALLVRKFVEHAIVWSALDAPGRARAERALERCLDALTESTPLPVVSEVMASLQGYFELAAVSADAGEESARIAPVKLQLQRRAQRQAMQHLRGSGAAYGRGERLAVGQYELDGVCAALALVMPLNEAGPGPGAGAGAGGAQNPDEVALEVLRHPSDAAVLVALDCVGAATPNRAIWGKEVYEAVYEVAVDATRNHVVRIAALGQVAGVPDSQANLERARRLGGVVKRTRNVLLREAALPALARVVAALPVPAKGPMPTVDDDGREAIVRDLMSRILSHSREDEVSYLISRA